MNSCLTVVVLNIRIFGFMLFIFGVIIFNARNFKEHQCYVNSTKLIERDETFHAQWNVTVLNRKQNLNNVLITSSYMSTAESTTFEMQKFKINQTYPCYGASKSVFQLPWQWYKPSTAESYRICFYGVLLIIMSLILENFKRSNEPSLLNTEEQQSRTLISIRNQLQLTIIPYWHPSSRQLSSESPPPEWTPPDSLPPTYEVAVQELAERQATV